MPDIDLKLLLNTFQQSLTDMKRDMSAMQTTIHNLALQVHDKLRLAEDIKKIEEECKSRSDKQVSDVKEELGKDIEDLERTVTFMIKTMVGVGTSLVVASGLYIIGM